MNTFIVLEMNMYFWCRGQMHFALVTNTLVLEMNVENVHSNLNHTHTQPATSDFQVRYTHKLYTQ